MSSRRTPDLILCWPGRTTAEYARTGISDYIERIGKFRTVQRAVVPEARGRLRPEEKLAREGEALLGKLESFEPLFMVVVDPRGKAMTSEEFARFLRRQCYDDARSLAFVVGGPDGVSGAVRERAELTLGLSSMTFPHDMARLMLAEQLYRGFTLIHGLPYSR